MCSVIHEYIQIGAEKSTVEIMANIMQKRHLTYDETADLIGLSGSDRERYRSDVVKAVQEGVQS